MSDDALRREAENLGTLAEDGRRVAEFLADPSVKAALARARDRYYDDFLTAKSDDDRRNAQAGRHALDRLASELAVVVNTGHAAGKELEKVNTRQRKPRS